MPQTMRPGTAGLCPRSQELSPASQASHPTLQDLGIKDRLRLGSQRNRGSLELSLPIFLLGTDGSPQKRQSIVSARGSPRPRAPCRAAGEVENLQPSPSVSDVFPVMASLCHAPPPHSPVPLSSAQILAVQSDEDLTSTPAFASLPQHPSPPPAAPSPPRDPQRRLTSIFKMLIRSLDV